MSEPPAVDASPLIFLSRAGLLDLLTLIAPRLLVPQPVVAEIERRGPEDPTVRAVADAAWIETMEPPPPPPVLRERDLGIGESAVLAWCIRHPGAVAVIDDLPARRLARDLDVPVRGTLGLVLLGKERGRIEQARPVLERLRRSGMYLSDPVLDRALRKVGE